MSQVTANDLLKDKNGFLWIGTADGLNRFDGSVFKSYKNSINDSTTISGNFINKLANDSNGIIWIGTNGNGLNYYDEIKDEFVRCKLSSNRHDEIITGIINNEDGSIWVSTWNNGLYRIRLENGIIISDLYKQDYQITSIFKDDQGSFWFGTQKGKLLSFDYSTNTYNLGLNLKGNIQAFYRKNDHLLIGSYEGLYIYNLKSKQFIDFELETSGHFKTMHVVDFLEERENELWIATGRGLYLLNLETFKVLKKIEYLDDSSSGLSNNTVQSLEKVNDDLLAVGTANGLNFLTFKEPYFNNISKNKRGIHLLNDNVVFSIYKDENLWVGTSDGGLNLLTDKNVYYFIDDKNNPKTIAGSVVRSIVHDKKNNRIWFATTRGLSMIDLKTFNPLYPEFNNFYHDPNNLNSINDNFIKDLVLDANGNLWGATHQQGVFRLEFKSNKDFKVYRYYNNGSNKNSLTSNATNCLELDQNNNVWVGTENGVSKLVINGNNYSDLVFENFKNDNNTNDVLLHNSVIDILVDKNNKVWVGTRNGLSLIHNNKIEGSWKKQKQFPNTLIYSIQDDLEGGLWIGTNDGMVHFDVNTEKFSHYNVEDNIQGKEFDTHARFRDSTGKIYLGGIDGVTYFNPKTLKTIDKPQDLYFSQLRVKDSIVSIGDYTKNAFHIYSKSPIQLEIGYDQFPFYLTFSSIDFRLNKNVQYAYKLIPLDENWNFIKGSDIQFLSLPSGEYNLQLNGFSRGEEWDVEPLEMSLIIRPPWWLTNLAYIFYVLLFGFLAYGFYKFQLSKKLAITESRRLKDIDKLKNSLYTNITHEFRTPITVILGMVDSLRINKDLEKPIGVIERNADNLLKMVNDMLDLTKLESSQLKLSLINGDVINFIKYLFESFESLANENNINYTFYSELDSQVMDYDSDRLSTIITNLLINAIKYTPEKGKVILHISSVKNNVQDYLQIKIVDTGIGLSEADIPNVFKKFYQVESSSRQFGGTGIGLALTKELVELMNGEIKVKSKLNTGSEFTILLPITTNAKKEIIPKTELRFSSVKNLQSNENSLYEDWSHEDEVLPIALVIEDNKDVVYYLKTCLKEKYKVIHAKDGEEGIVMANKYVPDVVICDVMMPKKNGFEVCSSLKSEIVTDHIPIILLTAKASERDRIEGLSKGADAYLVKPFNKTELFTRLDHLVSLRKKMISKFSNKDYADFINERTENPETLFLKNVISFIKEGMHNQEFDSSQLASKLHLSESQIYRKIKATTGRSTAVFIRSVRLNEAKKLIQTTNKTISEIAYEVGFNDPSWFSRAFKEEFKQSPSEIGKS